MSECCSLICTLFIVYDIILFWFPFETDDDHRVVLKSISGGVNAKHDYINAAHIDVSSLIAEYILQI